MTTTPEEMMMAEYTWQAKQDTYGNWHVIEYPISEDRWVYVASSEENARLWSAAPDLLAACEKALSLLNNMGTGKWAKTPAGDALRAAIAKAKGTA